MATTSFTTQVKFTQKNAKFLADAMDSNKKINATNVSHENVRDKKDLKEMFGFKLKDEL